MSRWFRFYDDAVNDPKLLRLSDKTFRGWVGLLCVASKCDGVLPSTEHLAFYLRVKPQKIAVLLAELVAAGLIDKTEKGFEPHNWSSRQFKADKGEDTKKDSYVYFIGSAWGTTLKVGFSKNPWARVSDLQTAHPDKLSVLAAFRCKSTSEVDLHDVLQEFRRSGEWFDLPTRIYVAVHKAADRSSSYEDLVAELRKLLRSATTDTETDTETDTQTEQRKRTRASALAAPWVEADRTRFWEAFPNKVGKADALKAFDKATHKTTPDVLFPALEQYAHKTDDRPFCNPATWLNQERWLDKPAANTNGRRTVQQAADDLLTTLRAFDEPTPDGLCDREGQDVVRLLPSR